MNVDHEQMIVWYIDTHYKDLLEVWHLPQTLPSFHLSHHIDLIPVERLLDSQKYAVTLEMIYIVLMRKKKYTK